MAEDSLEGILRFCREQGQPAESLREHLRAIRERAGVPRPIAGWCPMGCGWRLEVARDGIVRCTGEDCPKPHAVNELLADPTDHIVTVTGNRGPHGEVGFFLEHTLACRLLKGGLVACEVHASLAGADGHLDDLPPGRYVVTDHVPDAYQEPYPVARWDFEPLAS